MHTAGPLSVTRLSRAHCERHLRGCCARIRACILHFCFLCQRNYEINIIGLLVHKYFCKPLSRDPHLLKTTNPGDLKMFCIESWDYIFSSTGKWYSFFNIIGGNNFKAEQDTYPYNCFDLIRYESTTHRSQVIDNLILWSDMKRSKEVIWEDILYLPHKVKTQYLHFRSHTEYFLLSWIRRQSILFQN